jgi:outer membrane protein assembly factor BamB
VIVRAARALVLAAAAVALAGCSSMPESPTSWLPKIPAPRWDRIFDRSGKPGPLPELKATREAHLDWQVGVGKAQPGLAPALVEDALYAASNDGTLVRVEAGTGRVVWRISAGHTLSAGPGADDKRVVVGTDKGDVLAFDTAAGKPLWTAHVSTEVISPPRVADDIVLVFTGDGRVFGLSADEGKTLWVNAHSNPPLTVRNYAGGVVSRGGLFIGTAGGRLMGLDIKTGTVGFDLAVATPKGATELERIADVTSLPLVSERSVCAVAYQGRVACFEIVRGTLLWTRDISSLAGLTGDDRNIYVTDDKGSVHALDRETGASVWKQDALAKRRIGGPQLVGSDLVGVVDVEGYLHLLSRSDGAYVGRLGTDGKPATDQPQQRGTSIVWQSEGGTVYSVSAK